MNETWVGGAGGTVDISMSGWGGILMSKEIKSVNETRAHTINKGE